MKKLLFTLALLVSFNSFSQVNIYKGFSSDMGFTDFTSEYKNNFDTKYRNIKIGDMDNLFSIGDTFTNVLAKQGWGPGNFDFELFGGVYYNDNKLKGVQLNAYTDSWYDDVKILEEFFADKGYELVSVIDYYQNLTSQYMLKTGVNFLLEYKLNDVTIMILVRNIGDSKLIHLLTYNSSSAIYFDSLAGVPATNDSGF